ncbi:MAG: SAM-dependent DNA methyltransferase, partial [Candidatus Latescibacteria bacterium]|nr:SAM-dependent DNA methyltransferase [Candidatus Latescibacterota bacterium]
LKWLKDESLDDADELPEPEELVTDAIAELESAIEELAGVLDILENGTNNEVTITTEGKN